jgi:hypothetical protein
VGSSGPLSPIFTVNFDRLPGGELTATVSTSANARQVRQDSNGEGNGNGHARRELARL